MSKSSSKVKQFFFAMIALTFILELVYLYYIVPSLSNVGWFIIPAFILGLLAADILTGLVHWYGDTWGDTSWPILGHFFFNFRNHHTNQKDICDHDFVKVSSGSFMFAPFLLLLSMYLLHKSYFFVSLVVFIMTFFASFTNLFHRWAHQDKVPKVVELLQRSKLILSPSHHQVHHTKPHTSYYAITNGWTNWLFAKISFYRFLEWIGKVLFRSKPRAYEK